MTGPLWETGYPTFSPIVSMMTPMQCIAALEDETDSIESISTRDGDFVKADSVRFVLRR